MDITENKSRWNESTFATVFARNNVMYSKVILL